MRALTLILTLLALVVPLTAHAQPACTFVLGFKAIADQISTEVGQCLENEHFNVANGNAEQRTTAHHGKGGLLVWRKVDNWTAFTDGYWTWVNGPRGLQKRLNTERFSWEHDPISPPATAAPSNGMSDQAKAAITTLWQGVVAQAQAAATATAANDPRLATVRATYPTARTVVEVSAPIDSWRLVPGTPNVEIRGTFTTRARLVDATGQTIANADVSDSTPFVKIAVPDGAGWRFADATSVLGTRQCPATQPIKGNINDAGEHIYHVPGGASYAVTQPELCFATTVDAEAAGFRASQR